LVSKAETRYHDSQRKKVKSEASLNPHALEEILVGLVVSPDDPSMQVALPSCYSCRVGRLGFCFAIQVLVLEKKMEAC
jgi:hypothetical protein